jgi:hypothetical protein
VPILFRRYIHFTELARINDSAFFQVYILNISDVNIESKIFEILGIQLSADIIFTVYPLYRGRKERESVVFKYINISEMNIEKIFQILRNI